MQGQAILYGTRPKNLEDLNLKCFPNVSNLITPFFPNECRVSFGKFILKLSRETSLISVKILACTNYPCHRLWYFSSVYIVCTSYVKRTTDFPFISRLLGVHFTFQHLCKYKCGCMLGLVPNVNRRYYCAVQTKPRVHVTADPLRFVAITVLL
jgi:hypothetical protein